MPLFANGFKKWEDRLRKPKKPKTSHPGGSTVAQEQVLDKPLLDKTTRNDAATLSKQSDSCSGPVKKDLTPLANRRKGIIGGPPQSIKTGTTFGHPANVNTNACQNASSIFGIAIDTTSLVNHSKTQYAHVGPLKDNTVSSDLASSADHDMNSAPYQTIEQFIEDMPCKPVAVSRQLKYITTISDFLNPPASGPEPLVNIRRDVARDPDEPEVKVSCTMPKEEEIKRFAETVETELSPGRQNNNLDEEELVARIKTKSGQELKVRIARKTSDDQKGPYYVADTASDQQRIRKRKRPDFSELIRINRIHRRTDRTTFNIFRDGFLHHPELCLMLAAHLPVDGLIDLYSISKDFHVIVNQRLTTVILNQATLKAPFAARSYHWRCYTHLCQQDPSDRACTEFPNSQKAIRKHGIVLRPVKPAAGVSRQEMASFAKAVPSFRWLKLAIHREKTMWMLYHVFAASGVPLPGHPGDTSKKSFVSTLHKIWFMFDIPDNLRRIAYIQSRRLFTARDLSHALTFFVKLDMVLIDPLASEKRDALRRLLMNASDGFSAILRCLKHDEFRSELDLLRSWIRYAMPTDTEQRAYHFVPLGLSAETYKSTASIFGVAQEEAGQLKKQFWGTLGPDTKVSDLVRIDQLVLREGARRRLVFGKQFLRALLMGYVDERSETFEACARTDVNGGRSLVLEQCEEYDLDDLVAGVQALAVDQGGDDLLDLGDTSKGSPYTVVQPGAGKRELDYRKSMERDLEAYMTLSALGRQS